MSFSKNIVGKGFIAKNLLKINRSIIKSGYIIYAAGISNSQIRSKTQLNREINVFKKFLKTYSNRKIIYISTADVTNNLKNKSKYVKNKIIIEKIIKKNFNNYLIIRIPQIIGKSNNKKTLINFFYYMIKSNKKIKLFEGVLRNILDIGDVVKMIRTIILNKKIKKKIITLSNKYSLKPIQIIQILEIKLGKKANYQLLKTKKQKWRLGFNQNLKYFKDAKINFDLNYLTKAINKYY